MYLTSTIFVMTLPELFVKWIKMHFGNVITLFSTNLSFVLWKKDNKTYRTKTDLRFRRHKNST